MDWTSIAETAIGIFGGGVLTLLSALYLFSVKDTRDKQAAIAKAYAELLLYHSKFKGVIEQLIIGGDLSDSDGFRDLNVAWHDWWIATEAVLLVDPSVRRIETLKAYKKEIEAIQLEISRLPFTKDMDRSAEAEKLDAYYKPVTDHINVLTADVRKNCVEQTIADIISKS